MSAETEAFEQLILRSFSLDTEVSSRAMQQIGELPDEALLQLLASCAGHTGPTSRRLVRRLTRVLPYAVFALAVASAFSIGPPAYPHAKWAVASLGVGLVTILLWIFSALSAGRSNGNRGILGRIPVALIPLLANRTDVRFLPCLLLGISRESLLFERAEEGTDMIPPSLPLVTAGGILSSQRLVYGSISSPRELSQKRRRYRKLLKAILAQIGPEENVDLSADAHYGLLLLLQRPDEDVELTLCILTRLERWGDKQAVPVLKRLIREKHWYVGSEQVEEAARQCRERIESRLRQQKQNNYLLRPAKSEDTDSPQSLLRPATDRTEDASEQLLRPGNSLPPDRRG